MLEPRLPKLELERKIKKAKRLEKYELMDLFERNRQIKFTREQVLREIQIKNQIDKYENSKIVKESSRILEKKKRILIQ